MMAQLLVLGLVSQYNLHFHPELYENLLITCFDIVDQYHYDVTRPLGGTGPQGGSRPICWY